MNAALCETISRDLRLEEPWQAPDASGTVLLTRVAPSGECLRGEGLVWLIGAVMCSRGSNCPLARAMDGRVCAAAPLALAN